DIYNPKCLELADFNNNEFNFVNEEIPEISLEFMPDFFDNHIEYKDLEIEGEYNDKLIEDDDDDWNKLKDLL
ncbi:MAG: hypothetical protein ACTSPW_13260, partial [Promethearchaeota archaeon]